MHHRSSSSCAPRWLALAALSLFVASCADADGDSADSSPPTDSAPSTSGEVFAPVDGTGPAATSEDAGSDQEPPTDSASAAASSDDSTGSDDDSGDTIVDTSDAPVDSSPEPSTSADPGPIDNDGAPSTVAPVGGGSDDAGTATLIASFCEAYLRIDAEPLSDDEAESIAQLRERFDELRPKVPEVILDDFDVLDGYVDDLVAGTLTIDSEIIDPEVLMAGERLGTYVEATCDDDVPTGDVPPSDTIDPESDAVRAPGDPVLPDGIVIPVIEFTGAAREPSVPYFGTEEPVDGFTPVAADRGFCDAISTINGRPQPTEDLVEVEVGLEYFVIVQPLVPSTLAAQFVTIIEWAEEVLVVGEFAEFDEDDPLLDAVDDVNAFVDERCLGA